MNAGDEHPPAELPAARVRAAQAQRFPAGETVSDLVAVEEPLEIRVDGEPLAVLMRTPGDDLALTAGFLLTEGVIVDRDDLRALAPCRDPANQDRGNVVLVSLAAGAELARSRLARAQRRFFTSSSCGLCGKATIASLLQDVPTFAAPLSLSAAFLTTAGDRVRAAQEVFAQTGGLHAAAVFAVSVADLRPPRPGGIPGAALRTPIGRGGSPLPGADSGLRPAAEGAFAVGDPRPIVAMAEDVGRHNAVDKAIGALVLADALPLDEAVLWVSGRASFELVQKALVAGLRGLVCVGAPSSLAIELAAAAGLTLVGFARGAGRFNLYVGSLSED